MRDYSYQLFSSRNFPPVEATLRMVSAVGFKHVEGYGALFEDPDQARALRKMLDANGLAMPSAHFGLDLLAKPDRALEIAEILGLRLIFAPYLDAAERPTDAAGWQAFGAQLAALGAPLWDAGLVFGWHNHDFEFVATDGVMPIDLILASDPRLALELDLAWVVRAGEDPIHWMTTHASRIKALHLKDIAPSDTHLDEDGWADLGHGTLDWSAILGAAEQTAAEAYVVEHDNPSDDQRFARRSFDTLAEL